MGGGEPGTKLPRDVDRLVLRKAANAVEQGREIFAVHILHAQKRMISGFADVENAADIGVRNLTRYADFTVKAGQRSAVLLYPLGEELQCNGLSQAKVVRAVHLAH